MMMIIILTKVQLAKLYARAYVITPLVVSTIERLAGKT